VLATTPHHETIVAHGQSGPRESFASKGDAKPRSARSTPRTSTAALPTVNLPTAIHILRGVAVRLSLRMQLAGGGTGPGSVRWWMGLCNADPGSAARTRAVAADGGRPFLADSRSFVLDERRIRSSRSSPDAVKSQGLCFAPLAATSAMGDVSRASNAAR
jgi:hypothetical protein